MPQIIRPDADTTRTGSSTHGNQLAIRGQTTMFGCMDDPAAVAADYAECPAGSRGGDVMVVGLGNPGTTPTSDYNHIIGVGLSKDSSGGAAVGMVCELRQSYVSETDLGTLVCTFSCRDVPAVAGDGYYRYRLTNDEAELITDYTALSLRFVSFNGRGGAPRACRLHWAAMECPSATDAADDRGHTVEESRRARLGLDLVQESDRQAAASANRPI